MSDDLVLAILAGIGIAIGVVGTLLPVLPGLALVWFVMLAFGFTTTFGWVGAVAMAAATVLLAVGLWLGIRIPQQSAARSGLTRKGQLVGGLFAVLGFFVIPVIGAPIGFVLGVFVVRRQQTRDPADAWRSTIDSIRSLLRASFAQAVCGVAMAAAWGVWATWVVVT